MAWGTRLSAIVGVAVLMGMTTAEANEFRPQIQSLMSEKIEPWLSDPTVIEGLRTQNAAHANFDSARINALDAQWAEEAKAGGGPLIDSVLGNAVSALLSEKKEALGGVVSEMFVMDRIGLNVGQSDVTSDYWQGDEDKWKKTFLVGPDATFIDEVDFDESAEAFLSQASTTIVDPETGAPLGAITVGINVEKLF